MSPAEQHEGLWVNGRDKRQLAVDIGRFPVKGQPKGLLIPTQPGFSLQRAGCAGMAETEES
jgi:hypothetical protein